MQNGHAPETADQPDSSLLFGHHGPPIQLPLYHRIRRSMPQVEDFILDRWMDVRIGQIKRTAAYRERPRLRVLAVGVASPRRPDALSGIFARMKSDHHEMVFDQKGVEDKGKLENTNMLLQKYDLSTFDWIFTVDDDVALPRDFTDIFLALAESAQLKIAGPAHRGVSYHSYPMTVRRYDCLVRETSYVEVGPVTAFRREVFPDIFPFPNLRYGWGLDLTWPMITRRHGWRMGIVDAVPLQHLNPVAATYDASVAVAEARDYMDAVGFISREECWQTLQKWSSYPIT